MSSPWVPAIPQAMQRHGGSNWSLPKTKPLPTENSDSIAVPQEQGQTSADSAPAEKPKVPAL